MGDRDVKQMIVVDGGPLKRALYRFQDRVNELLRQGWRLKSEPWVEKGLLRFYCWCVLEKDDDGPR